MSRKHEAHSSPFCTIQLRFLGKKCWLFIFYQFHLLFFFFYHEWKQLINNLWEQSDLCCLLSDQFPEGPESRVWSVSLRVSLPTWLSKHASSGSLGPKRENIWRRLYWTQNKESFHSRYWQAHLLLGAKLPPISSHLLTPKYPATSSPDEMVHMSLLTLGSDRTGLFC